jgi:hypothetical protein
MAVSAPILNAVIPGQGFIVARDPAFLRGKTEETGSRVKPGMTVKVIS